MNIELFLCVLYIPTDCLIRNYLDIRKCIDRL